MQRGGSRVAPGPCLALEMLLLPSSSKKLPEWWKPFQHIALNTPRP